MSHLSKDERNTAIVLSSLLLPKKTYNINGQILGCRDYELAVETEAECANWPAIKGVSGVNTHRRLCEPL